MTPSPTTSSKKILIVDDEPSVVESLRMILCRENYQVFSATSVLEADKTLQSKSIDLVLTDIRLVGESGLDLVKLVHRDYPQTESIVLTAHGSIENAVEAIQAGAYDYITKPFTAEQLLLKIGKAVERRMLKQELSALKAHVAMNYGFDNIVGISRQIRTLKETAKRIAPTSITVLISGASGTGKELFARAIHCHSNRRDKQFIPIDCSAIPEALLESELFGHTKGSFTSAWRNKRGLLEEADEGTLFLDEVNNMPSSVQAKLLRFLQESEIRPVGSSQTRKVDVRVIAATNKDLDEMVAAGTFRDDLYYRLTVIPLYIPPLVERSEDVEMLTDYFLRKIAREMDLVSVSISHEAMERMRSYSWPGNVRELENTLRRAAALCGRECLGVDDITFVASALSAERFAQPLRESESDGPRSLAESQRTVIQNALQENNWNFTQTAQNLGIGRTTLWRKVKKYKLRRQREKI
ncbi:MAG: sigma-54-dependent transcriptional regulator [Candidatus Zixiibacteriota bacterium]